MESAVTSIRLSTLRHLWLIDIDGTILKHNGHLTSSESLLPGVREFWESIPPDDMIVLLSARKSQYREETLQLIRAHGLRFDEALFDLPTGERVLINDAKPSGLQTALAVGLARDQGLSDCRIQIDPTL